MIRLDLFHSIFIIIILVVIHILLHIWLFFISKSIFDYSLELQMFYFSKKRIFALYLPFFIIFHFIRHCFKIALKLNSSSLLCFLRT